MHGATVRRALAFLPAAFLTLTSVAHAADVTHGCSLQLSPAQTETDLPSRTFETELTLQNGGDVACRVTLELQELTHDITGAPQYTDSTDVEHAFQLGTDAMDIAPLGRRRVRVSGAIPAARRSMYVAVLATYAPARQPAGTSVETRTRIAAQFLLRSPKPWTQKLSVIDVGMLSGEGSSRQVYATVKNVGDVHVRPRGVVSVVIDGRVVADVTLEPARKENPPAVLPGLVRRLIGTWTPRTAVTGSIKLTAMIGNPVARGAGTVVYRKGMLLQPAGTLDLRTSSEGGALVLVRFTNSGNQVLRGVAVTLTATQDGKFERGRQVYPVPQIEPGQSKSFEWRPALASGSYVVVARAELGAKLLDQRIAPLRFNVASEAARKKGRPLLFAVAGVLLICAAGLLMFVFVRQRKGTVVARAPLAVIRTAVR